MKSFIYILLSMFFLNFLAIKVQAEFSQLEFDKPKKKKVEVVDPFALLEAGKVKAPDEEFLTTEEQGLSEFDLSMALVPSLKGSAVDADNSSKITSETTWLKNEEASCAQALDRFNTCQQARSLRELLNRFSGTDDFFLEACSERKCKNPAENSFPTKISIVKKPGYDFKFVRKETNSCTYSLSKTKAAKWVLFKVSDVNCSCLIASCFKD